MKKILAICLSIMLLFASCQAAIQGPATSNQIEDQGGILLTLQAHEFLADLGLSNDQFLKLKAINGAGDDTKNKLKIGWIEAGSFEGKKRLKKAVFQGPEDYLVMAKKLNDAYLGDFASQYLSDDDLEDQPDYSEMVSKLTELMAECTQIRFRPTFKITPKARQNAKDFLEVLEISQIVDLFQNNESETPLEIFESILDSEALGQDWQKEKSESISSILEYLDFPQVQADLVKKELEDLLKDIEPFKKPVPKITEEKKKQILEQGKKVMAEFKKDILIAEELITDLIESSSADKDWLEEKNKTIRNLNAILGVNVQSSLKENDKSEAKKKSDKNKGKTDSPKGEAKQKAEIRKAFRDQIEKVFLDIEKFKKTFPEMEDEKRKEIMDKAAKLLVSKEKKIAQLQKRVESIIAYQLSNPEFDKVLAQYLEIVQKNSPK